MNDAPRLLAGRYEVQDLLGHGGMAEVHLGHDRRLDRTVAIKILRSDLARDDSFLERFRREAQSAAALNHQSIVGVYDTGEERVEDLTGHELTIPYIVMEYVEGRTIRDLLVEAGGSGLPIDQASRIVSGTLDALEYSHRAGIVHRDIKPGNIMLDQHGHVKVMDFGIARALTDSTSQMTQTQAVMGTAQYLSPEQARGETVDIRSDLYSAACVLFEVLSGRSPFEGDTPVAIAYQHVKEEPPRVRALRPEVSAALDAVVAKGLAKERGARYQTAREFSDDIRAALAGRPTLAEEQFAAAGAVDATQQLDPVGATAVMPPVDDRTQVLPAAVAAGTAAQTSSGRPLGPATPPEPPAPVRTDGAHAPEKKRSAWPFVLIAVLLLALAGLVAWWFLGREAPPETVAMPELSQGMTQDEAESTVEAVDLVPVASDTPSQSIDEGGLVSWDPESGQQVPIGSQVELVFSSGPSSVEVPELEGKTLEEARTELSEAGLELGTPRPTSSPDVPEGEIISSDPAAGAGVAPGSTVDVLVSNGMVTVPAVTGMTEEDATDALEDLGLDVSVSPRPSEDEEVGTVLEQNPGAEAQVPQGATVALTVASEPEAEIMQDYTGQDANSVQASLTTAGYDPRIEETTHESVPEGAIISTDPAAGAELTEGQTITLTVSTGPQPTPEPSEEPSPPEDTTSPDEEDSGTGNVESDEDAPGRSGEAPGKSGAASGQGS